MEQTLSGLTTDILNLKAMVDDQYDDFKKVMNNSNRFIQTTSSASNLSQLYTNFKGLVTNSNVSVVQDYQNVDLFDGSFKMYLNNVALKRDDVAKTVCLNTGTDITFGVYSGARVYNSQYGRVALFDRATGLALRHGNGNVTLSKFIDNNWDFSWFIYKTESGKFELQNDWPRKWNSKCIRYDNTKDRFLITDLFDANRAKFTFGAGISQTYLTPNKTGLYTRIINTYFADNLAIVSASNAVNTPYLETVCINIADTNVGTGWNINVNQKDNFSVIYKGYFYAPVTGTYTFYLNSDEASYLWLGSNALSGNTTSNADINNGGGHKMLKKSANKSLTSGTYYPLLIIYGEASGANNIIFSWKPPNGVETSTQPGYLFLNAPV